MFVCADVKTSRAATHLPVILLQKRLRFLLVGSIELRQDESQIHCGYLKKTMVVVQLASLLASFKCVGCGCCCQLGTSPACYLQQQGCRDVTLGLFIYCDSY